MDFKITTDGELDVLNGEIQDCSEMEFIVQKVMCMIASVSHNWYYDKIGCDLEQIIGKPINNETISEGSSLIRSTIHKSDMLKENEFRVETSIINKNFIGFNVYINDKDVKYNYYVIEVTIDMVKGVNVKLRK